MLGTHAQRSRLGVAEPQRHSHTMMVSPLIPLPSIPLTPSVCWPAAWRETAGLVGGSWYRWRSPS
jgi:hypothetical protein